MVNEEIERKFFVTKVPDNLPNGAKIFQGYLSISEDGTEVRLRRKDETCYLTVKSGGDLFRKEAEIDLDIKSFATLWSLTENKRVEKTRFMIPLGIYTIELDVYEGALEGLMIAEVEFSSVDESVAFVPPTWFGIEVTTDKRFKNKNLAILGKPHE